jgi:hypothetical protein
MWCSFNCIRTEAHTDSCTRGSEHSYVREMRRISIRAKQLIRTAIRCIVEWPPLWSSGQSLWILNGDVLCLLWGTNWIYICYVEESRPHLSSRGQSSWLLNGDVLCLLWGTNRIYICYVEESRPPLLSSGQSSWLQIRRPGFDSRHYKIFWEVVGLERGPLSLVGTTEELHERKVAAPV